MLRENWKELEHKYQAKAKRWLMSRDYAALFLDPGLGKTAIAMSAFLALKKKGKVDKALIIAPRRVCNEVWTQKPGGELAKWKEFKDVRVTLLHGTKKEQALDEDADVYVINYEGIPWLTDQKRILKLKLAGVDPRQPVRTIRRTCRSS